MDYKARFYSPVLNRFIQPDTIVPNPMNPQAWNRYSYVVNSPINLNDPTGHAYCDFINSQNEEDCTHGLERSQSSKSNGGRLIKPKDERDDGYQPSTHPVIKSYECFANWACRNWREAEGFFNALQTIDSAHDVADLIVNYGRPAYRHLKGPASLGGPFFEGMIGGASQFVSDAQNPYLFTWQRYTRAGIIALEDAYTDVTSEAYGIVIGAPLGAFVATGQVVVGTGGLGTAAAPASFTGGALVGKIAVSTFVNEAMTHFFETKVNPVIFKEFNLGTYP